nr:hypothetical protein B0A51_04201 [Rachicladosporium sp. CCFEE 5018]
MAATYTGQKRSFHQMRDVGTLLLSTPSTTSTSGVASSRGHTPHRDLARDTPDRAVLLPSAVEASFRPSAFESDASVVLIGVKGVGKSSLGVLAANAYHRRLVESERVFYDTTGQTANAYRKLHGAVEYRKRHDEVLEQMLQQHNKDAVIVLSFADLEHEGAGRLRRYAATHPVVHVMRDVKGVSDHLKVWTEDRVRQLLRMSGPVIRACSNFDFFNRSAVDDSSTLDLGRADEHEWSEARSANGSFLTLKRAERDFLRLLRNIIGDHDRGPSHQSAYPLSQIPVEQRTYTYSVVVRFEAVINGDLDLEEVQTGADAVELIVPIDFDEADSSGKTDYNLVAKAFGIVRRASILPIILTLGESTRHSTSARAQRAELINVFLRLAPEFCTVDLCLGDVMIEQVTSCKGYTRIIGSKHFAKRPGHGWNDSECVYVYHNMQRLGCDVAKLTMTTTIENDNFEVKAFKRRIRENSSVPRLTCYNTGIVGRTSLCFNYVLTPTRPEGPLSELEHDTDQPLVTAKQLTHALFAIFKHEPMHFFIYGLDVSWSLSPAMHNAAYAACGMAHHFTTISSAGMDELQSMMYKHTFGGCAVVQPYKTKVVSMMTVLSAHAEAIGAVNSVIPIREMLDDGSVPDELKILSIRNRSGPVKALWGDNTDWIGLRACVRRGLSPANTVRSTSTGIVCGAGGQARAAVYALLSLGVMHVFVANRTLSTAHALADHYNKLIDSVVIKHAIGNDGTKARVRVIESFTDSWPEGFSLPTMVVCTIPSQKPDGSAPSNFTVPSSWLQNPTGGVAVELSYNPMVTPFVLQMRAEAKRGWILMDGFDHLPEQAFAQFELFTGRRAPRKLMRDVVLDHYRNQQKADDRDGLERERAFAVD